MTEQAATNLSAARIAKRYRESDKDPSRLVDFLAHKCSMGSLIDLVVQAIKDAEAEGVTRYKIAKDTGIAQPVLSRLVNGTRSISVETLEKLIEYFGITVTMKRNARRRTSRAKKK